MSLPVTILLLIVAIGSAVLSLRTFPRLTGDSAYWGIVVGFVAAVAAALVVNFHDPNDGTAILAGLITAFLATPIGTVVAFFVRRALTGRRR
jgi:uncharacterized membrane-anchored protein YitT (DUF2179 family)